jgi:hypothetical protein
LKKKIVYILFRSSVRTSNRTPQLTITRINWLMLFKEIIAVFSVADYKHRGPGFDSRALLRIFLRELGLERGPLSLVIG